MWKRKYADMIVSAEEAVKTIKSGDCITSGSNEAEAIINALTVRTDLKDIKYFQGESTQGKLNKIFESSSDIKVIQGFLTPFTKKLYDQGVVDFVPMYFSSGKKYFGEWKKYNVAVVVITPPDKHGYCSLGNSCDYIRDAMDYADVVIGEVNDQLPRTFGKSNVHVSKFKYLVENSSHMGHYESLQPNDISREVAKYLNEIVEDGATIEVGVGKITNTAVSLLDKKDIGIHTEVLGPAVLELMKRGVANGSRKLIDRGVATATMTNRNQETYDFINNNPAVEIVPASHQLNPTVIASNYKFTAINAAIQVDLSGQVNAESIRGVQYSGVGGQSDFNRGAQMCEGGKSIILIESTSGKGKFSKVVPFLSGGDVTSCSRCDIDYVVSEYGIAKLCGSTLRERTKAMISIAHPKFRDMLEEEAKKMFLI